MRTYGKIESGFWQNPKIKRLSEPAQLLLLYVYTCPHGNSVGCFVLPEGYIMADLRWPSERVSEHVSELVRNGFLERDSESELTRIRGWWGHNGIENDNVAKAAIKTILTLPRGHVFDALIQSVNELGNRFLNKYRNQLPTAEPNLFGNEYRTPEPNLTEPKPEPEPTRARATLPPDWKLPEDWRVEAEEARERNGLPSVDLALAAERFAGHNEHQRRDNWHGAWLKWALDEHAGKGANGIAAAEGEAKPLTKAERASKARREGCTACNGTGWIRGKSGMARCDHGAATGQASP